MEKENRIAILFEDVEIKTMSWDEITKLINVKKGKKFFLNRTEVDWLTEQKRVQH